MYSGGQTGYSGNPGYPGNVAGVNNNNKDLTQVSADK